MSLEITDATILVLAPHTDDGELGAGASISKWCRSGNSVHYVAFSACETIQKVPPFDILRQECARSTEALGVSPSNLQILGFEVRNFSRDRQAVLDHMVEINQSIRPDLVLTPSSDDTHQDHAVVSDEARRAFKRTRILGYEAPWNNFKFESTAFVSVARSDVTRKVQALAEYRTQLGRPYMSVEYQEAQLRFRGVQAGVPYAEAFQVVRWFL